MLMQRFGAKLFAVTRYIHLACATSNLYSLNLLKQAMTRHLRFKKSIDAFLLHFFAMLVMYSGNVYQKLHELRPFDVPYNEHLN